MTLIVWILVIVAFIENTHCEHSSESPGEPLSQQLEKKFRTLMDARLDREHHARGRVTASRAFPEPEGPGRLHEGRHLDVVNDESTHERGAQQRTVVSRRRARSQALRRTKLHGQSLRSHQQHSRRAARSRS